MGHVGDSPESVCKREANAVLKALNTRPIQITWPEVLRRLECWKVLQPDDYQKMLQVAVQALGPGPVDVPLSLGLLRGISNIEGVSSFRVEPAAVDPRGIQPSEQVMAISLGAGFDGGLSSFSPVRTFRTSFVPGAAPGGTTTTGVPTVTGTLRDICRNLGFGSLCDLGEATIRSLIGGAQPGGSVPTVKCPEGFVFDARSNTCLVDTVRGASERLIPGGATGVMELGAPVVGAFGQPALTPAVVGNITKRDGSTGPILRCPSRMVLGFDNLCYSKSVLPARSVNRKWKKPTKPPITASQWREIKGRKSTMDKAKEVATAAGFTCKRR